MDERFPALGAAVLDWTTRKDRNINLGTAVTTMSDVVVGGPFWSLRRAIFASVTVAASIALSSWVAALFGNDPAHSTSVLYSISRETGLSWRDLFIGGLGSFVIVYLGLALYWHMLRKQGHISVFRALGIQLAAILITILGVTIYVIISLAFFGASPAIYATYAHGLLSLAAQTLSDAQYNIVFLCQKLQCYFKSMVTGSCTFSISRTISIYDSDTYMTYVSFLVTKKMVGILLSPFLIIPLLSLTFIFALALARVLLIFGSTIDWYIKLGDQRRLLEKPLQFVGDIAATLSFVLISVGLMLTA